MKYNSKSSVFLSKWDFFIEFINDTFGPYSYKFDRTDCYFNDALNDRWSVVFPLKNKQFGNTEIFLETDDVIIAVGWRGSLLWEEKIFVDIINIKTEKKYRLFTTQVNIIYNTKSEVIFNAEVKWQFCTIVLNQDTMEKTSESREELQAFFKCVYNVESGKWYSLNFTPEVILLGEMTQYQKGGFDLKLMKNSWIPQYFDRKKFLLSTTSWELDVWTQSIV